MDSTPQTPRDRQQQQLPSTGGYPPMRKWEPPLIGRTGSNGGGADIVGGPPTPPLPPYIMNNPTKYPPYLRGPPPPGSHPHYRPPPSSMTPAESRYPPSSSRHEDYSRHPPPPHPSSAHHGGGGRLLPVGPPPPPAHYNNSFDHRMGPPPPQHNVPNQHHHHHHPGVSSPLPSETPTRAPPPPILTPPTRPHPADKFGKTITVSCRTSINEPSIHVAHPTTTHPNTTTRSPSRPPHNNNNASPALVTMLRPAPMGRSDAIHFSPSKSGAFLPYRPVARRGLGVVRGGPHSPSHTQARARFAPPPPRAVVNVVELDDDVRDNLVDLNGGGGMDADTVEKHGREEDVAYAAAATAENDVGKETSRSSAERDNRDDTGEQEFRNAQHGKEKENKVASGLNEAMMGSVRDNETKRDRASLEERKSNFEDTGMEESRDDNTKDNGSPEAEVNHSRETPAVAADERSAPMENEVVMEISEESKDADSNEKANKNTTHRNDSCRGTNATSETVAIEGHQERPSRLIPLNITPLKRPRSITSRDDSGEVVVNVDDDTPKHINISHPPRGNSRGNNSASVFRYPSSGSNASTQPFQGGQAKRSKFEDAKGRQGYHDSTVPTSGYDAYKGDGKGGHQRNDYPPNPSQTKSGRSYSLESIDEDRQEPPTAMYGGVPTSTHGSGAYSHRQLYHDNYYDANNQHPERSQHYDNPPPHPIISTAPSHGSIPGIGRQGSQGGGIRESWTLNTAPSQEMYPEPASYLANSRSMSWEVPAGTLSAIGSTLSFGWNTNTPGITMTPGGATSTPGRTTPRATPGGATPGTHGEEVQLLGIHQSKSGGAGEVQAAVSKSPPKSTANGGSSLTSNSPDSADVEDDEIPLLPSTGSNLPPRKRALLAPRPNGPSNKLFEPPRPMQDRSPHVHGLRPGDDRDGSRHVEIRHARSSPRETTREMREPASRYAPTTVHYPHERRQAPPPVIRSYSHDYHQQRHGADPSHYDARYKDYEPPRHLSHQSRYPQSPGRYPHSPGGRYDPRAVDRRGDPYQSPGRYPEYPERSGSHLKHPPTPGSSAPWGSPPPSSRNHPHHHGGYAHPETPRTPVTSGTHRGSRGDAPHTPGRGESPSGDVNGDSRSFDSSLSRRSFRSLDDLEDPVQSLLYRPSFSWEQGIEAPTNPNAAQSHHPSHHSSNPSSGHNSGHHPSGGHHYSSGHHYPTAPGAHAGYHGGPPTHGGHPGHPGQHCAPAPHKVMVQLREQQKILKALTMRSEVRTIGDPSSPVGLILLLAMPQDRHCLSETLCIVRNNVEVFTATEADINAPAPGRKRPIQIGQVGLRCVYCRMCNTRDRVKRATCFPSSMKRIYRAVIDMKLDHFKNCPYVPPGLKARLDQLQAGSTRSTGMTVQYFVKSAKEMGMVDLDDGVTIDLKLVGKEDQEISIESKHQQVQSGESNGIVPYSTHHQQQPHSGRRQVTYPKQKGRQHHQRQHQYQQSQQPQQQHEASFTPQGTVSNNATPPSPNVPSWNNQPHQQLPAPPHQQPLGMTEKRYSGKVLLSLPDDKNFLSPLRCFLREHVCAFTATARDIAVRTPTTFSVRVGQVGVGCIHCLSVPPKSRSNRAVCFPFTVGRIYQSVADIQRFHLGECRMMPSDVRATFLRLQSESAKGSRGLATRTYWIDSAKKIGLADGPAGMYFRRDPALPPPPPDSDAESLDILAQVASNNNSITKPLVTLEDKPTIAEFLYLVMEQLRPCRFTDADRNKRRSKNVGSVGVECKHCAGKIDGRKFFWSSVSAAESNFVSVHSHMLSCKYIPDEMKVELTRLKALRREQTSRLKTGSQKAFFTRVWARLHGTPVPATPTMSAMAKPLSANAIKSSGKLPKKIHPGKEVVFDTSIMKKDVFSGGKASGDQPLLHLRGSHDSDEIRALLESKSTLSSMPSADDSLILKHGITHDEIEVGSGSGGGNISDHNGKELKMGRSSESVAEASKSSGLTHVALNLSAVSVHCKEEALGK